MIQLDTSWVWFFVLGPYHALVYKDRCSCDHLYNLRRLLAIRGATDPQGSVQGSFLIKDSLQSCSLIKSEHLPDENT